MKLLAALLPLLLTIQVGGFVRDGAVEIIFPQAIRFAVNLNIPATDLTSAALTIRREGHTPETILVNGEQVSLVYGESQARLAYIWRIPVDDPPPLFSTIDYQWSFTASNGSVGTLGDSFTFADSRVDWVRTLDPKGHFSITAPRSYALPLDSLHQLHALLERNTGRTLDQNLMLYDAQPGCTSTDDPNKRVARGGDGTTVECAAGIEDAVFAGYQVLVRPADTSAEEFVIGSLVRDAYAPFWEGKSVPAWFSDGLATFYQPTPKNSLLPPVQQAARNGTLLGDMRATQSSTLWTAQSFGMIMYIADKLTLPGLFDLARVDADSFDAAYQSAMGAPVSALIPAWQQWIFTSAAASAYGITPYQPPTSTPTPSLTPSSTPTLTPTATLTPSWTPTPTLTPRGVYSHTPPPTLTPSPTSPPPPPTLTPRPPGSLPTITPTPTALQATLAQPAVKAGVGTFLVLLLGLLVFLLIRLGNRR